MWLCGGDRVDYLTPPPSLTTISKDVRCMVFILDGSPEHDAHVYPNSVFRSDYLVQRCFFNTGSGSFKNNNIFDFMVQFPIFNPSIFHCSSS